MRFALKFEVRSNFRKLDYIRTTELIKISKEIKRRKIKKKDVMNKMAQTLAKKQCEEKCASIDNDIHFQLQAPEVLKPQVLVKESVLEKDESQSIKKKLRKVFNKVKLNAKITEEVKCINAVNANLDAKILAYRNNLIKF